MILITGATGLIGKHITQKCVENGEKVRVLLRKSHNQPLTEPFWAHTEKVYGDILDVDSLLESLKNVSHVIHCAALVTFGNKNTDTLFKVNVEGTKNVVNACLQAGVQKLVYLSSVAAIGRAAKSHTIDETTQWTDSEHNSLYAQSKHLAEREVWRAIAEGLKAEILCPSVVLGAGDGSRSSAKIFYTIKKGLLFYPTGSVNVVAAEDVADAAFTVLKSPHSAERYIINAAQITYQQFFTKIAEGFGTTPPKYPLSKNLALIGYYVLKIFVPLYLKNRFINRETILITSSHYYYENKKFVEKYGFNYRPIDECIERTCKQIDRLN